MWANAVFAHLREHGYLLSIIAATSEREWVPPTPLPDAILVTNPATSRTVLSLFSDQPTHPLLILITDQTQVDFAADCADVIVPPLPAIIEWQIKQHVHLRTENAALRKENAVLQARLHEEVDVLKRSTSEIELLKNAIVRNVSHELKTPLLQVKAAVSLIAEVGADKELVQLASSATARLETVVKNITLLGSSLDISLGPVIIRDAIEYARRNLGRVWEYRGEASRVKVKLEEQLPPVLADKQAISTALQLLIDNALKFSEKRGTDVEVHAVQKGDCVEISVVDFGIGIAKDQLESIFDMFYQVDSSSTRRYGGTGVGLAIVRIIMERHNTKIIVSSKENEGSTFSFTLPAVKLG